MSHDRRLLVTGATGFVGKHVVSALRKAGGSLRLLVHRQAPELGGEPGVETVEADLAEPRTLRGICADVDGVVHLATHVGNDEETCTKVNADGTAALVAEARRCGVERIVYLSTAAIYGRGVHRGVAEDQLPPAPSSPTSRSRLAAERAVLEAGGAALRPWFIYGAGDRWFIPFVARYLRDLRHVIESGGTAVSVIWVEDLAQIIASLATGPGELDRGAMYHATDGHPLATSALVDALCAHGLAPRPLGALSYDEARAALEPLWSREDLGKLPLFCSDHTFDSSRLRARLPELSMTPFLARFADVATLYARNMHAASGFNR